MDKPRRGPGNLATLVAVISGGLSAAALIWAKEAYDWSLWTFLFVLLVVASIFFAVDGWIREALKRERRRREEREEK
jgi:hypothetical protein